MYLHEGLQGSFTFRRMDTVLEKRGESCLCSLPLSRPGHCVSLSIFILREAVLGVDGSCDKEAALRMLSSVIHSGAVSCHL